MNMERVEKLRFLSTEFLLSMIDRMDDLDEEKRQIAREEIFYVLYEREVKEYE